ncbi:hypothetical protein WDU94_012855, partial [Cyamophila willieti]
DIFLYAAAATFGFFVFFYHFPTSGVIFPYIRLHPASSSPLLDQMLRDVTQDSHLDLAFGFFQVVCFVR